MTIQHRRRFMGGRATPEQYHSKYAFPPGTRCQVAGCSARPLTRIIVMVPYEELRKTDPGIDVLAATDPAKFLAMMIPLKINGPTQPAVNHIRISTVYACKTHTPDAERAAAHGPSWAVVEINRGPGEDKPKVGWGTMPT